MSEQRMMTFQIHVENNDGTTKVREFRRAITDLDSSLEMLNAETADNVSVTAKKLSTDQEALTLSRQMITQNEKSIKQYQSVVTQYTNYTKSAHLSAEAQEIFNAQVRAGVTPLSDQGKQIAELVKKHQTLRSTGDASRTSMRNLRGTAQNLGWQLQDVAVQAQMGTDAFIILGQQGSQVLSAFGAAGALAGAGLAIVSAAIPALVTALGDTEVSTEELDEAQKILNQTFSEGKSTTSDLTDEMIRLLQTNELLGELKLNEAMTKAQEVMDGAIAKTKSVTDGFNDIYEAQQKAANSSVTGFEGVISTATIREIMDDLSLTREQVDALSESYAKAIDSNDFTEFSELLTLTANSAGSSNAQLTSLAVAVSDATGEFATAKEQYKSVSEILNGDLPTGLNETVKKYQELSEEINANAREVAKLNIIREYNTTLTELGDEATAKAIKRMQEERDAALLAADAYFELLDIEEQRKDASKEAEEQAKEREKLRQQAIKDAQTEYEKNEKLVNSLIASQEKQTRTLKQEYEYRKQTISDHAVTHEQYVKAMASTDKWYTAESKKESDKRQAEIDKQVAKAQKTLDKMQEDLNKDSLDSDPVGSEMNKYLLNMSKYETLWDEAAELAASGKQEGFNMLMDINDQIEQEELRHVDAMRDAQVAQADTVVSSFSMMVTSLSSTIDLIATGSAEVEEQMEEMTSAQKAMFIVMQSIAAAEAVVNGLAMGSQLAKNTAMYDYTGVSSTAWLTVGASLGAAQAGAIMGTTFAGAFDKGGYIPSGQTGIVSEYGDELVNGVLVKGPASVTGREATNRIMNNNDNSSTSGVTIVQNISANGDTALAEVARVAAQSGAEQGYQKMLKDLKTNGTGRKILRNSIGA